MSAAERAAHAEAVALVARLLGGVVVAEVTA